MEENAHARSVRTGDCRLLAIFFYTSVIIFMWRIADLTEELITDNAKMSFGDFGLEGAQAIIAQSIIILIFLLFIYQIRKWRSYLKCS